VRILTLFVTPALLLSGCAESQSIYHKRELSTARPTSVTVDADQRTTWIVPGVEATITTTAKDGVTKATRIRDWRICSEAAPDVFSANSASGSGAFSLAGLGKGGSPEGSAQGALAVAEVAATIERTQTINLLRESMYRTCERYLSGAIDRPTFVIQAARDQRTMVAVLAIEQLTRTARGPSTIIVPPKTTSTTTSSAAMDARLGAAAAAESAARSAADAANESYKTARATGKCDTVSALPVAGNTDPTPEAWTTCQNAKADLKRADEAAKAAGERHTQTIELAKTRAADSATASTEAGTPSSGGAGTQGTPPTGPDLARVSAAVVEIANAPQLDETLMFCVAFFTDQAKLTAISPSAHQTLDMCQRIMERRANIDNELVSGKTVDVSSLGLTADAKKLQTYANGGSTDIERQQRLERIGVAMSQLGLPSTTNDVAIMITSSNASAQTKIRRRLRALEPDPLLAAALDD
jgi:hypothetical protein